MTARPNNELINDVNSLVQQALLICPDKVPPQDTLLTDSLILQLLQDVIEAVDLPSILNTLLSKYDPFYSEDPEFFIYWFIEENKEKPSNLTTWIMKWVERITQDSGALVGIPIYSPYFSSDDFDYWLSEGELFFSICLCESEYLSEVSPEDLFDFRLGRDLGDSGVMALAMSPLVREAKYKPIVHNLGDSIQIKRLLWKFPLLALLADEHGLYGRVGPTIEEDNFLLGSFHQQRNRFAKWTDIKFLARDLEEVHEIQKVIHATAVSSPWLFGECLRTYEFK